MSSTSKVNTSLLSDDIRTDNELAGRVTSLFHEGQLASYLSTQVVVAVNNYGQHPRDETAPIGTSIAATQGVAARALARLGHRAENQAILFYGESGSGKTTLRSHLLSSILAYDRGSLPTKLSYAAYIFDSLTTTKTAFTTTASKSGLFYELQYFLDGGKPTLVGGKLLDHRVDRSRVTDFPKNECNYHIFYYLINGVSEVERQYLKFGPLPKSGNSIARAAQTASQWRYLAYSSDTSSSADADAAAFAEFKRAMFHVGFDRAVVGNICLILAVILYLGQLRFTRGHVSQSTGNESGGFGQNGGENVTIVENTEILDIVAAFLGLSADNLQTSLSYQSKTIGNERVTVLLDAKGAREHTDELARTLYALLAAYIMEEINQKLCASESSFSNTISIVDFPGPAVATSSSSTLDVLLTNTANECLYNFCVQFHYDDLQFRLDQEHIAVPGTQYFENSHTVSVLRGEKCLLSILDNCLQTGQTEAMFLKALQKFYNKKYSELPEDQKHHRAIRVDDPVTTLPGSNFTTATVQPKFTVIHYHNPVDYYVDDIFKTGGELISSHLANLVSSSNNEFVRQLFHQDALNMVHCKGDKSTILRASVSSKPTRQPSLMHNRRDGSRRTAGRVSSEASNAGTKSLTSTHTQGAAGQYLTALNNIAASLDGPDTNAYFFMCLRSNDRRSRGNIEIDNIRRQMINFGVVELRNRLRTANLNIFVDHNKFIKQDHEYSKQEHFGLNTHDICQGIIARRNWPQNEARVGSSGVFLSERLWFEWSGVTATPLASSHALADGRRYPSHDGDGDVKSRLLGPSDLSPPGYDDKAGLSDTRSDAGYSALNGNMFGNMDTAQEMAEKANEKKLEAIEEHRVSASRKRWLFLVWMLTWFIPDFLVKLLSKKRRKDDVRMAWREKVAINLLIWLLCAMVLFFMVGFPALICPTQHVYSAAELSSHDGKDGHDAFVAIRGVVYDLGAFAPVHYPRIVPQASLQKYAGLDITNLFPIQVSAVCNGVDGRIDPAVQLDYRRHNYTGSPTAVSISDNNAKYHDFRWATNDSRPDWWWEQQIYLKANYMKGRVGYSPQYIKTLGDKGNAIAVLNNRVYDFTVYVPGGRSPQYPPGYDIPDKKPDSNFMDDTVVSLFRQRAGTDITKYWEALRLDPALRTRMTTCLNNLFYVGDVDTRSSTKCLFSKYLLLVISIFLVSVIGFKFLAALQFGRKNIPEKLDKFVICTVPAYTEDEDSLRRAIDSAAKMKYDDKRKLLFIICDGVIIGEGNDRTTPRIVLDILGVPETVNPEVLSFQSLGEGQKQHNMGQVYTGLYEVSGHIVPFLVVVKTGRPSEVLRPGNRGKRDSQMVLMRFLNRVHYNLPMAPMELEMYSQIRYTIGVQPAFYEFLFQIDADTVVADDSATRMIATFDHDTRIIGVCGETALSNAKESFVTMMQVYEYYISHNLTKAFESLFGSVTCLPGCFSMYRIRDAVSGKPLFVSKEVVTAYQEIRVDTLHMKNLLHLGEDRYLTTLLLKFHPKYKTKYIFRAHAWTIAPDSWSVFMSQRRRWINSTVHNLIELIPLTQLCGFCCFSMRFVVFLDLLSTVVQPVIVGYIAYLIYLIASASSVLPVTAFILLGAIYGLQAIIFILRRKWEMIGWMIIYILATPIFAFGLPLYSFWHMDDFSWGNTRIVTGEKGKQVVVSDEGKFDPSSIPVMKWEDFAAGLMNTVSDKDGFGGADTQSVQSGYSYSKSAAPGLGSVYNYAPAGQFPYGSSDQNLLPNPSRPSSHLDYGRGSFIGSSYGLGGNDAGVELASMSGANEPTDDEITQALIQVFDEAGTTLDQLSRTEIRTRLQEKFAVNLYPRRRFIRDKINELLGIPPQ